MYNVSVKPLLTRPYAASLSSSVVTSATYANTTLNVTLNIPEIEMIAKYHLQQHVKSTHNLKFNKKRSFN